jgi:ribonuclease E
LTVAAEESAAVEPARIGTPVTRGELQGEGSEDLELVAAEDADGQAEPELEPQRAGETPAGAPQHGARQDVDRAAAEPPMAQPDEDDRPKRSGWWNRRSSFF